MQGQRVLSSSERNPGASVMGNTLMAGEPCPDFFLRDNRVVCKFMAATAMHTMLPSDSASRIRLLEA